MAVTKKSIDVPPLDLNEGYVARHRVKVAGTVNRTRATRRSTV